MRQMNSSTKKASLFFGDKSLFAIEIAETNHSKKFYIRLWFRDLYKGNFKRSGLLDDTITDYRAIVKGKDKLYLPVFDAMTMQEIFDYCMRFNFRLYEDSERYGKVKHLSRYAFTATQFSNTQSASLVLYKNDQLRLIWQNDFGLPVNDAVVPFDYFCAVFEEFVNFCKAKH